MNLKNEIDLILASASPRRKFLLQASGFVFKQIISEVNEDYPDELGINEIAVYLATKKARAIPINENSTSVVLAADTIVVHDSLLYGKPKSYDQAVSFLHKLSGNWHDVITGVCLRNSLKENCFSERTSVKFESLNSEEIEFYLEKYDPFDKAGAYGIQDWLGWNKISSIKGSYSNVMGLPMAAVYKALIEFGNN